MTPVNRCRVCGADLLALQRAAVTLDEHENAARQRWQGVCFGCQRERHAAAVEYEFAANQIALMFRLGLARAGKAIWSSPGYDSPESIAFTHAIHRIETARARCERLKMWPGPRAPRESETQ